MSIPEVSPVTDSAPMSLADLAYERLQDRLVMLDIRPGEPINDSQLAAEIGVGRTPFREALKRLETDHLVVSYPRRGTFVTTIDVTELGAISDIREQLMPFAARRAAVHANSAMRDALRAKADEVRSLESHLGDRTAMMRMDMSLHRLIYKAAGNPHLEEVLIRYDNLATRIWCLVIDRLPDVGGHVGEHVDLIRAIVDGQADRAADLARDHVTGFEQLIRSVI